MMDEKQIEKLVDRYCMNISWEYIDEMETDVTYKSFARLIKDILIKDEGINKSIVAAIAKKKWFKDTIISWVDFIKDEVIEDEYDKGWR